MVHKLLFLSAALAALFLCPANAQTATVNNKALDAGLYSSLQYVQPGFAFNKDTAQLRQNLLKFYTMPMYKADSLKKTAYYDSLKPQLAKATSIFEMQFLANRFDEIYYKKYITVTEDEAKAYYEKHKDMFTEPAVFSFLQVFAANNKKETIALCKKFIEEAAQKKQETGDKVNNETMTANYENDATIDISNPMSTILEQSYLTKNYGPYTNGSSTLFVYVFKYKPKRIKPYQDVKNECMANVQNEKGLEYYKLMLNKADIAYPIEIK